MFGYKALPALSLLFIGLKKKNNKKDKWILSYFCFLSTPKSDENLLKKSLITVEERQNEKTGSNN